MNKKSLNSIIKTQAKYWSFKRIYIERHIGRALISDRYGNLMLQCKSQVVGDKCITRADDRDLGGMTLGERQG